MFDFLKKNRKSQQKIYLKNTLTGQKEEFKPIKDGFVSMYNCGPTVYNRAHIGNLRPYIFADLLHRLFEYNGYEVKQVVNITDVGHLVSDDNDEGEDKVEKSAREEGASATEITQRYTKLFFEDIEKLNIKKSEITFPKATDYIEQQIELIKKLEEKGVTYKTSDGIYYDTSKFEDYGILGNVKVEEQKSGARVEENLEKRNKTDFALWKFSPKDQKRQQEWDSPWGVGFPGWHLECSVMSEQLLGKKFDIHTGGIDHIHIHHNNEIAQSQKVYGENQANYWIHHNHILIDNQKMAKSIGNIIYLSNIGDKNIDPVIYRYWLLTSHYSTLANFTWEALKSAESAYKKMIDNFRDIEIGEINQEYLEDAMSKINDDLDTPQAIASIWKMIKDSKVSKESQYATALEIDKILGLKIAENSQKTEQEDIPANIVEKAQKRQNMRKSGDFAGADKIRDELAEQGYKIIDKGDEFEIVSKK